MKIESLKEMTIQQLISMIENSDIEICGIEREYETERISIQDKLNMIITEAHTGYSTISIRVFDQEVHKKFAEKLKRY